MLLKTTELSEEYASCTKAIYAFLFAASNHCVRLNEKTLYRIPHLITICLCLFFMQLVFTKHLHYLLNCRKGEDIGYNAMI